MRKNISISDPIEKRAEELIRARGFSGLSDLIATLIREEWERRNEIRVLETAERPENKRIIETVVEEPKSPYPSKAKPKKAHVPGLEDS